MTPLLLEILNDLCDAMEAMTRHHRSRKANWRRLAVIGRRLLAAECDLYRYMHEFGYPDDFAIDDVRLSVDSEGSIQYRPKSGPRCGSWGSAFSTN